MMHKNGMHNQPIGQQQQQQQQQSMSSINRPTPPPPPQSSQMLPVNVQSPVSHPSPMQHQMRPMMPVQQTMTQGMPSPMVPQMMIQQQQPMMKQGPPQQQQQPQQHMTPQQMHPPQILPKQILCRLGADTVQDIVSKTLELFTHLRTMGPQLASTNQQFEDKKNKIKDTIKLIESFFIKLRKIYNNCNEPSSLDYVDPKSLLPLKDDDDGYSDDDNDDDDDGDEKHQTNGQDGLVNHTSNTIRPITNEEKKNNPRLQQLEKDYLDLVELNRLKNRQIKEIIDRIRKIVWDINTMLAMRQP